MKRWTDASLLVVEDMEPTGGRYLDLSSPIQVPAFAGSYRHEAEDAPSEGDGSGRGGSPHKFMSWNRRPTTVRAAWCTGIPIPLGGKAATTWPHPRPDGSGVRGHLAGEGYLPPISYWELEEAGIDFDLEGEHEVTLADGTKHRAARWSYSWPSRWPIAPRWASEIITGLDPQLIEESCTVWATRPEGRLTATAASI